MSDTGPAKLPGLPTLKTDDPALQRWAQAVAEHLEVRAGGRGNPAERSVTQRELLAATHGLDHLRSDKSTTANAGDVVLNLGGGMTVAVAIDAFARSIFDSPLYKNLMKRLDDQSRFDDVPAEVRKILLLDIAEEAARRGADIVRMEKKIQTSTESLAYKIEEVTAAIEGVSAGVRETTYASANANLATAGKVTQVQARLNNFAGGGPGTATIEQKMSVIASNVTGLSAEYTVKVQAGGIFGGFGLSAHQPADPTKPAYSMFLIAADKFGVVFPGNVGGADVKRIPFGIDVDGVYFNSDVYLKGNLRVDTGGSKLSDGLRGSLSIGVSGGGWSDAQARNAIYSALGRGASAPDNLHLVIGDAVTITSGANGVTKYWNGSSWTVPGVVISGDMIVDGSLSASKINTNGLVIRDAGGTPIFGSGVNLGVNFINGLGTLATQNGVNYSALLGAKPPADADRTADNVAASIAGQGSLATQNGVNYSALLGVKPPADADRTAANLAAGIMNQGALATQNGVRLGHNVTFPDGSVINSNDLVSKLSKINSGTIGTFIDGLAITNAYIGNAAIKSANIDELAVTTAKIGYLQVGSSNIQTGACSAVASGETTGTSVTVGITVPADTVAVEINVSNQLVMYSWGGESGNDLWDVGETYINGNPQGPGNKIYVSPAAGFFSINATRFPPAGNYANGPMQVLVKVFKK